MTSCAGCSGIKDGNAPIFAFGFNDAVDGWVYTPDAGLPKVCTSVPRDEPTVGRTGRVCKGCYRPEIDPDGEMAMFCGAKFYEEGMTYTEDRDHNRRIDCFRAAELLYLHAAAKGHPYAFLGLGYIYCYDRCEGDYWGHWEDLEYMQLGSYGRYLRCYSKGLAPYPRDERAIECFQTAAEAGIAEACYKLGDMLRDGRGCEVNFNEAYRWFSKAYELGVDDAPVVWGSAALRLGRAHEEGEGCMQSFEEALTWYERATTGLSIAVRCGEDWYCGALRRAESGLARTTQEIFGRY